MQGLPEIGDVLDDTYEITEQIGQGGFGAVYLARQMSMDREVALKVLVAHAMKVDEMIQRFRREVMAVRNLSHPNTIRIYDFHDRSDGVLYYSMEYVRGPTLKDIIKLGPLAPSRVKYILRQILKSLSEAHSYGIVHRDLKPANIMLAEMHGEEDFVKVLDFGIAKIMDQNDGGEEAEALTSAGVLVGTLRYMAPEQIAGGEIGPQSDLYALGLIGVEMLTGHSVFAGTGRWEVLHKQISDEPVDIPESVHASGMHEYFRRSLSKTAGERFSNADEMLKAIDELTGLPTSPIADSTGAAVAPSPNTPISQSAPNSGVGQPVTGANQRVFDSAQQVPVPVAAAAGAGAAVDAADEATQFHALPSEQAAAQASAAQSGQMQMQPGNRQPMMTPMPRQGAAFQTNPPDTFGASTQVSTDNTGSFADPAASSGNGKLLAIAAFLILVIVGGGIAVLALTGNLGGGEGATDPAVAGGVDAGVANAAAIAAAETTPVEVVPPPVEETVEPKWVRVESGEVEAQVFNGDKLVGKTPLRLSVEESQILLVKADGFEDQEIAVGPDSQEVVPVALKAIPKEEPKEEPVEKAPPETTKKTPPKKKAPKKVEKKEDDGWLDVPTKKKKKTTDVPIF